MNRIHHSLLIAATVLVSSLSSGCQTPYRQIVLSRQRCTHCGYNCSHGRSCCRRRARHGCTSHSRIVPAPMVISDAPATDDWAAPGAMAADPDNTLVLPETETNKPSARIAELPEPLSADNWARFSTEVEQPADALPYPSSQQFEQPVQVPQDFEEPVVIPPEPGGPLLPEPAPGELIKRLSIRVAVRNENQPSAVSADHTVEAEADEEPKRDALDKKSADPRVDDDESPVELEYIETDYTDLWASDSGIDAEFDPALDDGHCGLPDSLVSGLIQRPPLP